jgi:hypothetical protein
MEEGTKKEKKVASSSEDGVFLVSRRELEEIEAAVSDHGGTVTATFEEQVMNTKLTINGMSCVVLNEGSKKSWVSLMPEF